MNFYTVIQKTFLLIIIFSGLHYAKTEAYFSFGFGTRPYYGGYYSPYFTRPYYSPAYTAYEPYYVPYIYEDVYDYPYVGFSFGGGSHYRRGHHGGGRGHSTGSNRGHHSGGNRGGGRHR